MNVSTAAQKISIFADTSDDSLPVKPVRTERLFGVPQRPSLSAERIESRINQLVRHGSEVTSSGLLETDMVNTTYSLVEAMNLITPKIDKLLDLPKNPVPLFFTSTFAPIQEWEGYVREIGADHISADLIDVTAHGKKITEQAEIPFDELSDADRQKLRIGSIFRWSIGYQRTPSGTKMRVSNIVFRDLPRWTQKDIHEAREEARKLEQYFRSASAKETIVFVVEDDASMRTELTNLFQSAGLEVELFGSAPEMLQSELPDVASCLVLDIRLPGLSGLDFQAELAKANIHIPIIFMTGHGDIPMSVRAIKGGAVNFLTKPFPDQDMLDAVTVAIERDRKRREADKIAANLQTNFETLTPREREILALVSSGLMNKQIALQLELSEITVRIHRRHIMKKMGARSSAELVWKADALGIHRSEP